MSSITFFFIFIPLLSVILLSVNFIFAPHNPYKEKKTPFECGYHSFLSQNRTQFTISFFIFALLFLIFDLEIVLIYPYSVSSYANNIYGLITMIIFTLIVTVGFIFELGKNALKIESKQNKAVDTNLRKNLRAKTSEIIAPKIKETHLIILLFISILITYILIFGMHILTFYFLNIYCCLFYIIVMFLNYIYRDKNTYRWQKVVFAFKNYDIIFKYLKANWKMLLFILACMILIQCVTRYYYDSFSGFKWEDHYILHMNKILFISPFLLILHCYLFNRFILGKLPKLTDALKSITIGRFLFILLCYTLSSYCGFGHIILVYFSSFLYEVLLYILDFVVSLPKMHSLTNGLFKNISECVIYRKKNFMLHYFSRNSRNGLKNSLNIKFNHISMIKSSNLMRNLLFDKAKISFNYITISSLINKSIFYQSHLLLGKKLYISGSITTEKLIGIVTNNKLSITNYAWPSNCTRIFRMNGQVYILLPLVGDKWVFITSDKYMLDKFNNLNFKMRLARWNNSSYSISNRLLTSPNEWAFKNLDLQLSNLKNVNNKVLDKLLDSSIILNSNKLPWDNINAWGNLNPSSNLNYYNLPWNNHQEITVRMMPSVRYDNTNLNQSNTTGLDKFYLINMTEQCMEQAISSSSTLNKQELDSLRLTMKELIIEGNKIKEFMKDNCLVFIYENRNGFAKIFVPDILDSDKKLISERLLKGFNVAMANFLQISTLILTNQKDITHYSSLAAWPYEIIGVNFPLWNIHDIQEYTKTKGLSEQLKSIISDVKVKSIFALVPYLGEYYEQKHNTLNYPVEGSSKDAQGSVSKKREARLSWGQKREGSTNFPVMGVGPVWTAGSAATAASRPNTTAYTTVAAPSVEGSSNAVDLLDPSTVFVPDINPVTNKEIAVWDKVCDLELYSIESKINKAYIQYLEQVKALSQGSSLPVIKNRVLNRCLVESIWESEDFHLRKALNIEAGSLGSLSTMAITPHLVGILENMINDNLSELEKTKNGVPLHDPYYIQTRWYQMVRYHLTNQPHTSYNAIAPKIPNPLALKLLESVETPYIFRRTRNTLKYRLKILEKVKETKAKINWEGNLTKLDN